jgi:hypothetical protein
LDINNNPAKLTIRGEYTKTKVDRYVFLTREVVEQRKIWIDYKYRKRRVCYYYKDKEKSGKKTITEYRTPEKKQNELIFLYINLTNHQDQKYYMVIYHLFLQKP